MEHHTTLGLGLHPGNLAWGTHSHGLSQSTPFSGILTRQKTDFNACGILHTNFRLKFLAQTFPKEGLIEQGMIN